MRVTGKEAEMPRLWQLEPFFYWRCGGRGLGPSNSRFFWARTQLGSWVLQSLLGPGLPQRRLRQLVPMFLLLEALAMLLLPVLQQLPEAGIARVHVVPQALLGLSLELLLLPPLLLPPPAILTPLGHPGHALFHELLPG